MYTSFYKLKTKPFQISSDPKFLWFGEKHREALATLKYGVLDNKGFLLLTGDVGTGKTTLINALIESLNDDIIKAFVPDPSLSKLDFFNYIALAFGIGNEFLSKGAFLIIFRQFLMDAYENKKKVLLIIDESQLLTQELLEEIRLLSNIEKTDTKLINIFFVGQNEFNEIVNLDKNRAVRQRLTLNYNLDPLTLDETEDYIKHRLKVAGAKESIFDKSSMYEVFMYSGGFPRRINVICDHALLSGYVNNSKIIAAQVIQECAKELNIPAYVKHHDMDGYGGARVKPTSPVQRPRVQPGKQPNPVILTPRTPEKKQKQTGNIIMLTIAVLFFSLICWWMLLPVSFQQFISNTNKQMNLLKNQISESFREVPISVPGSGNAEHIETSEDITTANNQAQNQSDTTQRAQLVTKKDQIQKPDPAEMKPEQAIVEPLRNEKKKNDLVPVVQNNIEKAQSNNNLSKEIFTKSESIQDKKHSPLDSKLKVKNEIVPLPVKPVVIRFKYDTNDLAQEDYKKIEELATILAMHPDAGILIYGYTDSYGNAQYNQRLSEFRANIVKSFLLGKGVIGKQIIVKGLGSTNPVESNNTPWGRKMNRRVEIECVR